MKINLKMALVVTAAAVLSACGSSDDAPPTKVATIDTVVQASASTTAAAASVPFVFPGGVQELGTTGTTTVAFTSTTTTPNFTIESPGVGTASGTTTERWPGWLVDS